MSSDAAFLRAILAHPDEDGPRLVYADWLDERGDPRGEFIRVQCEAARCWDEAVALDRLKGHLKQPPDNHDQREQQQQFARELRGILNAKSDLDRRGHALLEAHGVGWATPLAHAFGLTHPRGDFGCEGGNNLRGESFRWGWSRGFVETISLPERWFVTTTRRVFNLTPVRAVALTDKEPLGPNGSLSDGTWWWGEDRPRDRTTTDDIASPILKLMEPTARWVRDVGYIRLGYEARAAALESLSQGCVAYGRSLVKSTSQAPSL